MGLRFVPCLARLDHAAAPIDEHTTVTHWVILRSFLKNRLGDRDTWRRTQKICLEDQPIVETQKPELVPYDASAALHVRADRIQLAYRKLREQFLELGDRIEVAPPRLRVVERSQVIPGPARRAPDNVGAWVMPEVEVRRTNES